MARGPVIQEDELFEVANRLEAEGKEVTALALLEALGRGSLTTIYKHLEVWKSAKPAKVQLSNNEMPERVKTAFMVAWREASQEAGLAVEEVREKAKEEVAAALRQFHGALEAIAKLEKDKEAQDEAIEGLQKQLAEAKAEAAKAESEGAAEKARADELREQLKTQQQDRDAALKEAAETKGQLESLKAQNQELLNRLSSKDKGK
jgi:chromosome segregation ATPase